MNRPVATEAPDGGDRMWLDTCNNEPKRDQHQESAPCWI